MSIVRHFPDGSYLEYAQGGFDSWCVYITTASGKRIPPHDIDYFNYLKYISGIFGRDKVYIDFVSVYDHTEKSVQDKDLAFTSSISASYGDEKLKMDKVLTILYMAMIAEENKQNTRLGKRIKRLGIYKLLIENEPASKAANFMRGMTWRDIDTLCKERGF